MDHSLRSFHLYQQCNLENSYYELKECEQMSLSKHKWDKMEKENNSTTTTTTQDTYFIHISSTRTQTHTDTHSRDTLVAQEKQVRLNDTAHAHLWI